MCSVLIAAACQVRPCKGITLRDVALTPAKGCLERFYFCGDKEKKVEMKCSNAHGTASNVSPPSCLSADSLE